MANPPRIIYLYGPDKQERLERQLKAAPDEATDDPIGGPRGERELKLTQWTDDEDMPYHRDYPSRGRSRSRTSDYER